MTTELKGTGGIAIAAVRAVFGEDSVTGEPAKLAGGAMHDSWGVDARADGSTRQLVVRVSPAGRADHAKTRREFAALRVAHARGIRCPEPIAVGECETGEDYLVMARGAGDTNPRQLLGSERYAETRANIIGQLAQDLARIHGITASDVDDAPGMRAPAAREDALRYERRLTEDLYRTVLLDPHPAIDWAFRWIDRAIATIDAPARPHCLVHGDFRIGNMLYDEHGLTSILDWEGVHIGEPEEDVAWLCTRVWRFNRPDLEAGGIAPREDWLRAYEQASGRSLDRARVAAWEVLQNIRWAQITMMQARAHLDGHTTSHELAAIGRRTAETELEILRLAGVADRVAHAG
ncbi:MAG TPA: phosphotransferase family protein [Dehalococcoidia bacterium]|nr:phosphotransferase family protein [Dehalococcoidia bacterium]